MIVRFALNVAARRLAAALGIVVGRPRQVGKSALLHALHDQLGGAYVTLDVAAQLRAARIDPAGFLTDTATPLFLDESNAVATRFCSR